MTHAEVVVDASVAVRGLLYREGRAAELMDGVASGALVAHAPDLLVPEVVNALRVRIDAQRWPVEAARERLEAFLACPIVIQACGPIADSALAVATERGLSGYDALYAVFADALEVPLITADRRLAAAVAGSMLVE